MHRSLHRAAAVAVMATILGFACGQATAGWSPVVDADASDSATNPGYPTNQSPSALAAYLQDLLNLSGSPTLQSPQATFSGGSLSGLGNPAAPNAYLLALHFGNGNDQWEHDGPFNVFFTCQSECDSFSMQNPSGLGNYRLYATGTAQSSRDPAGTLEVPEPASLALLGLGLVAFGLTRRK